MYKQVSMHPAARFSIFLNMHGVPSLIDIPIGDLQLLIAYTLHGLANENVDLNS